MSDKRDKAARGRHAAGPRRAESDKPIKVAPPAAVAPVNPAGPDAASYGAPGSPYVPAQAATSARRAKPLKVVGIVLGAIVALLAVAYVGVALYFSGRFMPNSSIGEVDVSLMEAADAERVLADSVADYRLSVSGQGFSLRLTAADAGLSIDEARVVSRALAQVNPWAWPLELQRDHDATSELVTTFNETGLDEAVRSAVAAFNEGAEQPVDASVAYDEAKGAFVVRPESAGTALDPDAVIAAADEALAALAPSAKLTAEHLLKPAVLSTDARLASVAASANTMIKADLALTMGGAVVGEANADTVSQWVTFGEDATAALDEGALTAWVDGIASSCSTVGSSRTYTRPDGKTVTVAGGSYGWEVDRDALLALVKEAVSAGSVQTAEVPTISAGMAFNGAGAQDWGPRYCDIDLSEQYVRFYDGAGALVWESACVTGTPNGSHDTPPGVYVLNSKASPSKLKGTNLDGSKYESTVQYWMPFVGNVIGMHDADWQAAFGGTRYQDGYGSHGCVNLPPGAAAQLYGIIQTGDVVVCHW